MIPIHSFHATPSVGRYILLGWRVLNLLKQMRKLFIQNWQKFVYVRNVCLISYFIMNSGLILCWVVWLKYMQYKGASCRKCNTSYRPLSFLLKLQKQTCSCTGGCTEICQHSWDGFMFEFQTSECDFIAAVFPFFTGKHQWRHLDNEEVAVESNICTSFNAH